MALADLALRLTSTTEVVRIGAWDDEPETVFGRIQDAALTDTAVAILDSQTGAVRWFDYEGSFIRAVGALGDGPVEFRSPEKIALLDSDRIGIFEARGVKLLDLGSDRPHLIETISVEPAMRPDAGCMLMSSVVLRRYSQESAAVIHLVDLDTRRETSIVPGYPYGSWLVRREMNDGPIACEPEHGVVAVGYATAGYIEGYEPGGELMWRTRLGAFEAAPVLEGIDDLGEPFVSVSRSDAHHRLQNLVVVGNGLVLAQVMILGGQGERRGFNPLLRLKTYLIRASDGQGMYVGDNVPWILDIGQERVAAASIDANLAPILTVLSLPAAK